MSPMGGRVNRFGQLLDLPRISEVICYTPKVTVLPVSMAYGGDIRVGIAQ
jgi:hypothetical protein